MINQVNTPTSSHFHAETRIRYPSRTPIILTDPYRTFPQSELMISRIREHESAELKRSIEKVVTSTAIPQSIIRLVEKKQNVSSLGRSTLCVILIFGVAIGRTWWLKNISLSILSKNNLPLFVSLSESTHKVPFLAQKFWIAFKNIFVRYKISH